MVKESLEAHGCKNIEQASQCIAHDYMTFQSQFPASQILNELYHRSESPSFDQFLNDKSISHLRQDNHKLFTLFQQYSSLYNNEICLPLKQFLLSKKYSFKGQEAEKQLIQLSEVFQNCKDRGIHMHAGCAEQMDVFFPVQVSENEQAHPENDDSDSDDDDDEYAAMEEANASPTHLKHVIYDRDPLEGKFKDNTLVRDHGIDKIMRREFKITTKLDKFEPYSYSRHEMKFIGDSVHTLTTADTIPQLLPENTRLFREYHTINAMKRVAATMGNMLCFSYHILQSCIQLFCYILANGEIYGQRVFSSDLVPIFNSLYPESKIHAYTIDEMNKNMQINNKELLFDDDQMYMESDTQKLVLFKRKYVNRFKRKDVTTESYIEYAQSNVKNKQEERIVKQHDIAESETLRSDVLLYDEEECMLECEYVSQDVEIGISRQMLLQLKERTKEDFCNVDDLYHYIDISTGLQIKDQQVREISIKGQQQGSMVINYDLFNVENKCLYGIVVKMANDRWRLREFLTEEQVVDKSNITFQELPTSSRKSPSFNRNMMKLSMDENVIEATNWCNIEHNYGFLSGTEIPLIAFTFKICHHRLIQQCQESLKDENLPQFRILVQDDNDHWIEWIKVIRIKYTPSFTFYTAIQFGYDRKHKSKILEWLNNESPGKLPHDLEVMIIQFCIPVQIKSIHHDPRYILSLHRAVGHQESGLSVDQLSCLFPWPKQFEIGEFKSELVTTVEVFNTGSRRHIDISSFQTPVNGQTADLNYSYFLSNSIRMFQNTFAEISHGSATKIYRKLRGQRKIEDVDKKVDFETNWNVDPFMQYYKQYDEDNNDLELESIDPFMMEQRLLLSGYIRIEILADLSMNAPIDIISLCYEFYKPGIGDYCYISS